MQQNNEVIPNLVYPENDKEVILLIYDLSNGLAKNLSVALVGKYYRAVFHTSIICFKKEYFFGGGVQKCNPYNSGHGRPIEIRKLGNTELDEEIFQDYIKNELSSKYNINSYNLFDNNCNHFTNDAIEFLLDEKLDDEILNQAKSFQNTPLGSMIGGMTSSFDGNFTNNNANNPLNFNNNMNQNNNHKVVYINNLNDFIEKTSQSNWSVLYFYSDTCPPCKSLAPFYDEWSNKFSDIKFFKINTGICRDIANEFSVQSIPTLVFMKDGLEKNKIIGFKKDEIENYIKSFK